MINRRSLVFKLSKIARVWDAVVHRGKSTLVLKSFPAWMQKSYERALMDGCHCLIALLICHYTVVHIILLNNQKLGSTLTPSFPSCCGGADTPTSGHIAMLAPAIVFLFNYKMQGAGTTWCFLTLISEVVSWSSLLPWVQVWWVGMIRHSLTALATSDCLGHVPKILLPRSEPTLKSAEIPWQE